MVRILEESRGEKEDEEISLWIAVDGSGRGGRTVDQKSRGDPWVMRGSCVPHRG